MGKPNREQLRKAHKTHNVMLVARVKREYLGDEPLTCTLQLIGDDHVAELADGDEFVTLLAAVDPWEMP